MGVAVLLAALQVTRIIASSRAETHHATSTAAALQERDAIDERARARPPLGAEPPSPQECGAAYAGLRLPSSPLSTIALWEVAWATPGTETVAATAVLEVHRAFTTEARRSAHCSFIEIDHRDEKTPWDTKLVSLAAFLAVVEGHERLKADDVGGAVDRYLDGLRLAVDTGFVDDDAGAPETNVALKAIGELLASGRVKEAAMLERVAAALRAVRPFVPSPSWSVRRVRMELLNFPPPGAWTFGRYIDKNSLSQSMTSVLFGDGAVVTRWVDDVAEYTRLADTAIASLDIDAQREAEWRLEARARATWPFAKHVITEDPRLAHLFARGRSYAAALARLALAEEAVALEETWLRAGRFPDAYPSPRDPCAKGAKGATTLKYAVQREGKSYRAWSVGYDGRDDDGVPESGEAPRDLVLEAKREGK